MTRKKGDRDLKKRKPRSDKGKTREIYAKKKVKYGGGFLNFYHKNYGEDLEFTKLIQKRSRDSVHKHYHKNKKKIQNARWLLIKSDPNRLVKDRVRTSVGNMFRRYIKEGKIMTSKKYGIDYRAIIEHLKPFPENLKDYHIDHIKPLCSFNLINLDGSTNLKEIKKAFAPENLRWLIARENQRKNAMDRLVSVHPNKKNGI